MQNYINIFSQEFKSLMGLDDQLIKLHNYKQVNEVIYLYVHRERSDHTCPSCAAKTNRVHDYHTRKINHGVFNYRQCFIIYNQRRFICDCGKKFNEINLLVDKYNKISNNTKLAIFEESKRKVSFKDIAYRLNISATTVIRTFLKYIKQPRRDLPRVLSIDEFKGNSGGYKYLVSLVDSDNKTIIDILPCRHKEYLRTYFSSYSTVERSNVKIFTTDMWGTYKDIAEEFFPNATIVADTFHFVRHIYWAFNNTRIRIMKKYKKSSKEYRYLKKYWKLLIMKSDKVSDEIYFDERTKNFNSQLTIIDFCRNIHPELNKAYELKEYFYGIVDNESYPSVYKKLSDWIIQARVSYIGEFITASNTIENWLIEITNSFMINPVTDKKYSNGYIEGTNNFIKSLKRISYGIKRFDLFRNKIMYQHKNSQHIITV